MTSSNTCSSSSSNSSIVIVSIVAVGVSGLLYNVIIYIN